MVIPARACVANRELTEPRLSADGRSVGYAVSFAGSAMLVVQRLDGTPARQLTTWPAPRTGRGMGGGCWCWSDDGTEVVYVASDGNLWRQPLAAGDVCRLTDLPAGSAASSPVEGGGALFYTVDDRQVWRLAGDTATRLDGGEADFCFDPAVGPGGTAEWIEWNVPDMPWDAARLCNRPALPGAAQQPRFTADGRLLWLGDVHGWLNLWCAGAPLVEEPCEHGGPLWGPGQRSFAPSPDGDAVAFTRNERGFGRLCVVDVATRTVREVAKGVHGQLSWAGDSIVALRSGARTPTQIVRYDTSTWERTVIAVAPPAQWDAADLAEPELAEATAGDGTTLHGRLYRATAPAGRLLVWLHGGPTDQWQVTFMPRLAYWRAQGWNVLVPDHRGSTGHGRAYQQALRGRWGELDVDDTLSFVGAAHDRGWGRSATTVAIGGSAGGFTALGAVAAAPERFAAAVVSYPVSDLADLAARSHRFEAHYTDSLIGPLPAAADVYARRSPQHFAARLAGTPLLVMHGSEDPVVPYEQSEALVAAVRVAGGIAELHCYEGEGHGWRQPENQIDEYLRIGSFLARHVALPG